MDNHVNRLGSVVHFGLETIPLIILPCNGRPACTTYCRLADYAITGRLPGDQHLTYVIDTPGYTHQSVLNSDAVKGLVRYFVGLACFWQGWWQTDLLGKIQFEDTNLYIAGASMGKTGTDHGQS